MKKKHIVIVTPYYAPAWAYGGPPRVLSTLAAELIKRKIKVTVITTDTIGDKRTDVLREVRDGVSIHRFKVLSNYLCYNFKFFFVPRLKEQSLAILKTADYVLFSDVRSALSEHLFSSLLNRNIPYGVFVYGQIEHGDGWKSIVKKIYDILWVRKYIHHAKWIFTQTDHESLSAVSVLGTKKENVFLSLLPIPSIPQIEASSKSAFRKKFKLSENDKILLFVGRFHYFKGVDLLIRAVTPILEEKKNVYLFLIGRDDGVERFLRSIVPKHLSAKIIFAGPLYEEEVKVAYAAADVFVFTPRYFENTSTATLEALAAGIPVVTTEQADIPFLQQYKAGHVVRNDPKKIESAVRELLRQDPIEMRKRAKKIITEKYLVTAVADQLLKDMDI